MVLCLLVYYKISNNASFISTKVQKEINISLIDKPVNE
ncbi:hypothetical protein NLO413_0635 [Candidatus Neoehrlichia lotoris str. RAC413]|uniref:Uncharacterized protein n=1 Tax=Candidatus Neoehrlichia procyonis str. RAC413 TaxID=1359163 RepID=A0A0F3NMG5_9RICK|nr:hypothetical protein NLO413_0635 [Candidatus Neoehrlichia lotoris str. RAC413]